ncbi:hypothetical protein T492DRAFT_897142 [Pavlovales sp. CCMP2436]|nr:hypothetical protein T492DRAFT_897142 [Pavlovales sp. CCMP2436]
MTLSVLGHCERQANRVCEKLGHGDSTGRRLRRGSVGGSAAELDDSRSGRRPSEARRAAEPGRRGAEDGRMPSPCGNPRAQALVPAPADAFANAPADASADAGIEELVVPSPVADATTGVAAAPAADAPADAPAAELSLLSQTLQVLLPALPLHILFRAASESIPEFITRVITQL